MPRFWWRSVAGVCTLKAASKFFCRNANPRRRYERSSISRTQQQTPVAGYRCDRSQAVRPHHRRASLTTLLPPASRFSRMPRKRRRARRVKEAKHDRAALRSYSKMRPVSPRRAAVVAGLDIGTSKIVCLIARLEPQAPQERSPPPQPRRAPPGLCSHRGERHEGRLRGRSGRSGTRGASGNRHCRKHGGVQLEIDRRIDVRRPPGQ